MPRRYDHRVRNAIVRSGNPALFPELKIPPSTIRDWMRKGEANVVTSKEFDLSEDALISKVKTLESRLREGETRAKLITSTVSILGFQLQYVRVPSAQIKAMLIEVLRDAAVTLGLASCLETIKLSRARFSAWLARQKKCELEDKDTCGRLSPTTLLPFEVRKIRDLVTNQSFRHFSITSLALYAKRENLVHASVSTWHKIIGKFNLKRPGQRLYPPRRRIGIRASAPGQIWHLDMSVIKLKDGKRCFIQAVVDNFSRYVLAWKVMHSYGGVATKELLESALKAAGSFGLKLCPTVMVDGGSENHNTQIDNLIEMERISIVHAQVEIDFSNSMVESLFHRMKNSHLYLQELLTFEKLKEETDFYLKESNERIPMASLEGATPLEVISGSCSATVAAKLSRQAKAAMKHRILSNLTIQCIAC